MKKVLACLAVLLACCVPSFAGDSPIQKMTADELTFLSTGPRLYTMDAALALSERTGKPVVCWMGAHLFADKKARDLSRELGDSTIQAAMDSDGTEGTLGKDGKVIPTLRVKFSTSNYDKKAATMYIPVEKMDRPGTGAKILSVTRGGGTTDH